MFRNTSIKKTLICVVALLMLATVAFAACNGSSFKPTVDLPTGSVVVSTNGGIAVQYGDYIYYVNGLASATTANTYENVDARTGAICRIKVDKLDELFEVYNSTTITSSSDRTKEIARLVAENAQLVVPKIYFTSATTTNLNGIYIFDDRIYIATPEDQLTSGGNTQTSKQVLMSFKLDGSDMKRHYVFDSNTVQVMYDVIDNNLVATYVLNNVLSTLDVAKGTSAEIVKEISNATFDVAGRNVFFTDKDGSVCMYKAGETEHKVLVDNSVEEGEDASTISYSIKSVNNGNVYYTKSDSDLDSDLNGIELLRASESDKDVVILTSKTFPDKYYGYGDKIVYVNSDSTSDPDTTLYGIFIADGTLANPQVVLSPIENDTDITFNRLEGDTLYYTVDSVSYSLDLSSPTATPVAYAKSLSTSAQGWALPDVLDNYVFTLTSSGTVTVVKFDADKLTNTSSVNVTVVAPEKDEDK